MFFVTRTRQKPSGFFDIFEHHCFLTKSFFIFRSFFCEHSFFLQNSLNSKVGNSFRRWNWVVCHPKSLQRCFAVLSDALYNNPKYFRLGFSACSGVVLWRFIFGVIVLSIGTKMFVRGRTNRTSSTGHRTVALSTQVKMPGRYWKNLEKSNFCLGKSIRNSYGCWEYVKPRKVQKIVTMLSEIFCKG